MDVLFLSSEFCLFLLQLRIIWTTTFYYQQRIKRIFSVCRTIFIIYLFSYYFFPKVNKLWVYPVPGLSMSFYTAARKVIVSPIKTSLKFSYFYRSSFLIGQAIGVTKYKTSHLLRRKDIFYFSSNWDILLVLIYYVIVFGRFAHITKLCISKFRT